jgi:hypothetical protein
MQRRGAPAAVVRYAGTAVQQAAAGLHTALGR